MARKSNKKTKIILSEGVRGLGLAGEVVGVNPGYARNFLLPQRMATLATKSNLAVLDERRSQLEAEDQVKLGEATELSERLQSLTVTIRRNSGDSGRLFGSVTRFDVSKALAEAGAEVSPKVIFIPQPIKDVGEHVVFADLHPRLRSSFKISVEQSHS